MNALILRSSGPFTVVGLKIARPGDELASSEETHRRVPGLAPGVHPVDIFNDAMKALNVRPLMSTLDPDMILFSPDAKGKDSTLRAEPLPIGRIINALGLEHIIPSEGELDVHLVGALVYKNVVNQHRHPKLPTPGYNAAHALIENQSMIPNNPWVRRLRLMFPYTIMYREETGVCIPMVEFRGDAWVLNFVDVHSDVITGVDMLVHNQ